jgi:hypothetical protein
MDAMDSSTLRPQRGVVTPQENLFVTPKPVRLKAYDPIAQARRADTQRRQAAALKAWRRSDIPEWLDEKFYREQVQPRLRVIPYLSVQSALSVSEAYALRIRGGKCVPHPRHWLILSRLVQIDPDKHDGR